MGYKVLNNGIPIPEIGYGTWQIPAGETAVNSIKAALSCGYRLIDGASVYKNQTSIGLGIAEAIKEGIVKREDIFLTSKVWNKDRGYEGTIAAFEKSLHDFGVDYLDLYLIHWPASSHRFENWEEINLETWKALTDLYKAGRVRAIGVSNFEPQHLTALIKTEVMPMVDQLEINPGNQQINTVEYCRKQGIQVEAWSPNGSGRMLCSKELQLLAAKYHKDVAQLCVRWAMQNNIIPLPRSVMPARIASNFDVQDFTISEEDMKAIASLEPFGNSGQRPDEIDF